MNSGELTKILVEEFEQFYDEKYNFKVRYELYNTNSAMHASIKGRGDLCYLRFSPEFCDMKINNFEDFIFISSIVSHELAHYVNHHNYIPNGDVNDYRLLEAWADRCSMKIMLCLLAFSERVGLLCEALGFSDESKSIKRVTQNIGKSLFKSASTLFIPTSDWYDKRLPRVMHCVAGVNSFLDDFFGGKKLGRAYGVMSLIYINSGLEKVINEDFFTIDFSSNELLRIREIHYKLQNGRPAITEGLKRKYRRFIDTSFAASDLESRATAVSILFSYALQAKKIESDFENFSGESDKFLHEMKKLLN